VQVRGGAGTSRFHREAGSASLWPIQKPLTEAAPDNTTFLIDAERSATDLDEALDDDEVAIVAITAAELRVGVLLSAGKKRAARLAFLEDVLAVIPVLYYDRAVASRREAPTTPARGGTTRRADRRREGWRSGRV
jgi:hypothetical protein